MADPSSSQNYYGSQDDAFERALAEMPLPLDEEPSPSPPPELDRPPSSPAAQDVIQIDAHRRPRPTSPSEEPDEIIQLQSKQPKRAANADGPSASADPPAASQPGWASLKREKTKAEIEQEKHNIAFGASKFGGIGDYMTNKRMKLYVHPQPRDHSCRAHPSLVRSRRQFQQQETARAGGSSKPQIFKNVAIYVRPPLYRGSAPVADLPMVRSPGEWAGPSSAARASGDVPSTRRHQPPILGQEGHGVSRSLSSTHHWHADAHGSAFDFLLTAPVLSCRTHIIASNLTPAKVRESLSACVAFLC